MDEPWERYSMPPSRCHGSYFGLKHWFRSEKRIFAGALALQHDFGRIGVVRGNQVLQEMGYSPRRIGGDVSTVQEKKRKYRHQQ